MTLIFAWAACGGWEQHARMPTRWPSDGPAVRRNRITYWPRLDVGTTFTDGVVTFSVAGTEPATLRSVETLGASSGFKVLGVSVAGPARKFAFVETLPGEPPLGYRLGPIRPAVGYRVKPGWPGVELLIGISITAPGIQRRTGLRIVYSVAGTTYQIDYDAGIVNCPVGTSLRACGF